MQVKFKDANLKRKYDSLSDTMRSMRSAIVAYSGGVDSTLVAVVAHENLGDKAIIVTANSASLAPSEFSELLKIAGELKFNHRVIYTKEVESSEYKANTSQRCYFCKEELYTELKTLASKENIPWITNGTNVDDLGDFRPGIKAAKDFIIRSPLVEVGINKDEVRAIAKEINISNWDKPAQACLSSRVAYGIKITDSILNKISLAEEHVKSFGISQVRVRHHGNLARIEVPEQQISILLDKDNNKNITERLKKLGYVYVTVDLQGFRSGSMNDQLTKNPLR
jgi:uncharacterized protein